MTGLEIKPGRSLSIIVPTVLRQTVEIDPGLIDFEATYTIEAVRDGRRRQWIGVEPLRGDDGRAIFNLPGDGTDVGGAISGLKPSAVIVDEVMERADGIEPT